MKKSKKRVFIVHFQVGVLGDLSKVMSKLKTAGRLARTGLHGSDAQAYHVAIKTTRRKAKKVRRKLGRAGALDVVVLASI